MAHPCPLCFRLVLLHFRMGSPPLEGTPMIFSPKFGVQSRADIPVCQWWRLISRHTGNTGLESPPNRQTGMSGMSAPQHSGYVLACLGLAALLRRPRFVLHPLSSILAFTCTLTLCFAADPQTAEPP